MTNGTAGKKRSPGIDILLFIVTLGVYWFVWNYKAFNEFAKHRGQDLKSGTWVAILVVVWIVTIVVASYNFATTPEVPADVSVEESFEYTIENALRPAAIAAALLGIVYYILQLLYQKPATQAVKEAGQQLSLTKDANPTLAVLFNLFFLLGQMPIIGGLFALIGVVLAIIWVVQIQNALNEYWDRAMYQYPSQQPSYTAATQGQTGAPFYGPGQQQSFSYQGQGGAGEGGRPSQAQAYGGPAPAPEGPSQQGPQDQPERETKEKTFACPNCNTHVTVNYRPGEPTPVQCHSCGQRGTIR